MQTVASRRGFLIAASVGGGWLASGCGAKKHPPGEDGHREAEEVAAKLAAKGATKPAPERAEEGENETAPAEDLMREHGLLERLLVVFEEGLGRGDAGAATMKAIHDGATLVRRFIEDYHEKLEEEHLFPRLEQAGKLAALVATLRAQHLAGRQLTDAILAASGANDARALAAPVHAFARMYRPHAAREDTVVFPAFKALLPRHEYEDLGEKFEGVEHQLFGPAGFEGIVDEVASLEQVIGVADLATFTPAPR
jgi:hemerythrin-like domain-containing protein